MYYGKGFTHSDVYNMPIYLRNFYYQELIDTKKKESKEAKTAQQKSKFRGNMKKTSKMVSPHFCRFFQVLPDKRLGPIYIYI